MINEVLIWKDDPMDWIVNRCSQSNFVWIEIWKDFKNLAVEMEEISFSMKYLSFNSNTSLIIEYEIEFFYCLHLVYILNAKNDPVKGFFFIILHYFYQLLISERHVISWVVFLIFVLKVRRLNINFLLNWVPCNKIFVLTFVSSIILVHQLCFYISLLALDQCCQSRIAACSGWSQKCYSGMTAILKFFIQII